MPTKRAVLNELTRDELRDNLDRHGLDVHDRRVRSQLVDALAGSRKARLDEIVWALSRDRLKALCRALDLEDSGRRKGDLVERLVGPARAAKTADGARATPSAPASAATAARTTGNARTAAASPPAARTADPPAKTAASPAETLGVEQLERYL